MRNVKRIDTGHTHGWQVCIRREGEEHTKLFSDKKYGGRDVAKEKARVHRDEMLEKLPDLPGGNETGPPGHLHTPEMRHRIWRDKLTRTGVKGIGFRWANSNGSLYPRVSAMYEQGGKRVQRSRSIAKHGLKSALKQMANVLYEGRGETGPEPEEIYEQALPTIEELLDQEPAQPRVAA